MKVRSGFVSNSSSSSFVIIAKPGKIDKLIDKEDDVTQTVARSFLDSKNAERIKLDGNEYDLYQFSFSTEEFGCDMNLADEDYEVAYDKWNDFEAKLTKQKDIIVKSQYS
jgi:hypothetical protein